MRKIEQGWIIFGVNISFYNERKGKRLLKTVFTSFFTQIFVFISTQQFLNIKTCHHFLRFLKIIYSAKSCVKLTTQSHIKKNDLSSTFTRITEEILLKLLLYFSLTCSENSKFKHDDFWKIIMYSIEWEWSYFKKSKYALLERGSLPAAYI